MQKQETRATRPHTWIPRRFLASATTSRPDSTTDGSSPSPRDPRPSDIHSRAPRHRREGKHGSGSRALLVACERICPRIFTGIETAVHLGEAEKAGQDRGGGLVEEESRVWMKERRNSAPARRLRCPIPPTCPPRTRTRGSLEEEHAMGRRTGYEEAANQTRSARGSWGQGRRVAVRTRLRPARGGSSPPAPSSSSFCCL